MKKQQEQPSDPKLELVGLCCQALDDKKAEDIRILDVSALSSITDYLIVATGNSEPHLRGLTQEVSRVLKEQKHHIVGHEMNPQTGWTVLDAHDVIVHIFTPEMRDLYRLDSLWKDGADIDVSRFVTAPEPLGRQRGR